MKQWRRHTHTHARARKGIPIRHSTSNGSERNENHENENAKSKSNEKSLLNRVEDRLGVFFGLSVRLEVQMCASIQAQISFWVCQRHLHLMPSISYSNFLYNTVISFWKTIVLFIDGKSIAAVHPNSRTYTHTRCYNKNNNNAGGKKIEIQIMFYGKSFLCFQSSSLFAASS